jgi:Uma2 family endonuclease
MSTMSWPHQTLPRRATYEDYRHFPDDGKRYEILDGRVYMTPSPSTRHQYASMRLQTQLAAYFEPRGPFLVFSAPLDVILDDADIVQPDLLVVERGPQMSGRGIEGAPIVIVEILSPSRPDYDRVTKPGRYAVRGVPHFWIVDAETRAIECYRLEAGAYTLDAAGGGPDTVAVPSFDGLVISLERLWLDFPTDPAAPNQG